MDNFDYYFYTQYYGDLKSFNERGAQLHYIKHGKKEERMCNMNDFIKMLESVEFDYNFYSKLHNLNFNKGMYNHLFVYKTYTRKKDFKNVKELKTYLAQLNFDPYFYNNHYKLNLNQESDLMIHYIKYGKKRNFLVNDYESKNDMTINTISQNVQENGDESLLTTRELENVKNSFIQKEIELKNKISNFEKEKNDYELKIKNLINDFEKEKLEFEKFKKDIIDSYNLKEAILLNEIDAEKYRYSLELEKLEFSKSQKMIDLEEKIINANDFVNDNLKKMNELKEQYQKFKRNEETNLSASRFFFFQQIENENNKEKVLRILNESEVRLNNNLEYIKNELNTGLSSCEIQLRNLKRSFDEKVSCLNFENKINNKVEDMDKIKNLIELQENNLNQLNQELTNIEDEDEEDKNQNLKIKEEEIEALKKELESRRIDMENRKLQFEEEKKNKMVELETEKNNLEILIENYRTHLKIVETEIFLKKKSFRKEVINLIREEKTGREFNVVNYPTGENYKYLKNSECLDIGNQIYLADYNFLNIFYEKFANMETGGIRSYLMKEKKYHIWNNNVMVETIKFINFDWEFYRANYTDLHFLKNEYKSFKHFVNNCFTESRLVNFDLLLKDNTKKILLLSGKNDNLEFMLKQIKNDYLILRDDLVEKNEYSKKCLNLADIVICEKKLDWILKNKKEKNFLILNLLDYSDIKLQSINVDFFNSILILGKNKSKILNIYPNINSKLHLIPNFCDFKIFQQPKTKDCKFNFGLLNFTPMNTNPIKCVELFISILKKNPNFKLFIKGENPYGNKIVKDSKEEQLYYKKFFNLISKFKNNIFVDYSENINSWLNKVGYIFLFSNNKININLVKLAMATGSVPYIDSIVNRDIFPEKFFNILNLFTKELSEDAKDFVKKDFNLKLDHYNIYNKSRGDEFLFTNIMGGLGNQLFMLFNLISLGYKLNKSVKFGIDYDYYNDYFIERKKPYQYNLLKKISYSDDYISNLNLKKYEEKQYKYAPICLCNDKKNYLICGYFQSYKYFWDNIEEIKKNINLDNLLISDITKKYKSFNKPVLSIHIRLGDYVKLSDYHPVTPLEYYKKALSFFKLENYQIIVFSDDVKEATKKLEPLNLNYINADDIYINDEEQFYMLMLSDARICTNSSFSIMACYFNEMYNFVPNSEYIFPHKFFGDSGPEYSIEDHKLNYKFYYINYDTIPQTYTKKYDVVTNLHIKDKDRYKNFLKYNKKYLLEADQFYYISYSNYDNEAHYISEDLFPFSKKDIINYLKEFIPDYRLGWYYQQLLKLYSFRLNIFQKEYILIFDSDLLLLKNVELFIDNKPKIFKRNTDANGGKIHDTYLKSINYLLPDLNVDEESGICHFMLFHKKTLDNMLNEIENYHQKPAWEAILDSIINYIQNNGYHESIFSEYETYYAYTQSKNLYIFDKNFKYQDASLDNLKIGTDLNLIADHHYQVRTGGLWKKDNLVEEHLEDLEKLKIIFNKYSDTDIIYEEHHPFHRDIFINKIFNYLSVEQVIEKLTEKFNNKQIFTILYEECKELLKNKREEIDNLIYNYTSNIPDSFNNQPINKYISTIKTNINKHDKFYFGIVIPVFNRYYITKLFFECLKKNINFKSIVFCIVDDGSNSETLKILDNIDSLNYITVYCKRCKNFYGSNNTTIPGSMYPMTLYIGHQIIREKCQIMGVLDSDSFIKPEYFKICEKYTKIIDMDNTIFSGFNSYNDVHKIYKTSKLDITNFLYKDMVGGISQFYSTKLYEQFKFKFTGEESLHFFAYDYDYQISNFMKQTNKSFICLEESLVQHIGIKTSMIRNNNKLNNDDREIIDTINELLVNPAKKDEINIDFDFDKNLQFNKSSIDNIFKNLCIDRHIDKVYYINLDERVDRKQLMESQFKKFNITNYERVSGVKPKFNPKYDNDFILKQIDNFLNDKLIVDDLVLNVPSKFYAGFSKEYIKSKSFENKKKYILGALGCKLSHLKCLKKAYEEKYSNLLILEDDCIFHNDFNNHIVTLIDNIKKINYDYDMIWLVPNWLLKNNDGLLNRCYSYKFINQTFALVNSSKSIDNNYGSASSTGGQLFSSECIKYILNNFENSKQSEIDIWYRENIQKQGKVYTTIPNILRQDVGPSNIEGFKVNYDKDLHYKTRFKFNIFTIVNEEDKDKYIKNLSHNLMKMIGYENIYYLSDKELFDNEILHFFDIKKLEGDTKLNFVKNVNHNIQHYYYMDMETRFENNFLPFDENNNLILPENFYCKN